MTCGHYLRFAHVTLRFRTSPGSTLISRCNLRATGSLPTFLCAACFFFGGGRVRATARAAEGTTDDHLQILPAPAKGP